MPESKEANALGQLALGSLAQNKVDELLQHTPYGAALQGALDFRQPIMDAVRGTDDTQAIINMLSYFLASKLNKPSTGIAHRALPAMPRNSSSVVDPAQSRALQLYDRL